ncbi:MAG: sialate O-acetylesterase [Kiritimatiellae bacterium]|nr:sialate O-acetylesterase [Kiritimatiellia bacterium]
MRITTGLLDHMVLQRNRKNVSEADFSGVCEARGPVKATVRQGKRVVKGFDGVGVGVAARGKISGCLKGLPAGGPYDIELKVAAVKCTVRDVLVGDVWLLGGQSNMQGCGLFPRRPPPVHAQVRAFYMDDRWAPAKDPIHNLWECVDPVHVTLCGGRPPKPAPDWGVCPGPAFGAEMRRLTGVPQGMLACAHGGTSMSQWDPKLKQEGGKSLYGAMIRRLAKNGHRVAGLVWYQGCSDASAEAAPLYTQRMKNFVAALRRDSRNPTLPVAIVQIARVIGWSPAIAVHWNSIQDQQRRLPSAIKALATVSAVDLPLDDCIHISGEGQQVLGVRLARAMQVLRGDRKAGLPPIELGRVWVETERGLAVVNVEFRNVLGGLCAESRPTGFTLVDDDGANHIIATQVEGRRVRIRSTLTPLTIFNARLFHGYGTDPYCNIHDEGGRALPAFGPVPTGIPRAATPFIRELRVSAAQPSAGKLEALELPATLDGLGMRRRTFRNLPEGFCDMHRELQKGQDELLYYACRIACPVAMSLAVMVGYDGPVKVWVDGTQLYHDPNGVNPAVPCKGMGRFKASAGEHEIVVALGSNQGAAWGIFLQLERLGLTKRQLIKEPPAYAMPTILG